MSVVGLYERFYRGERTAEGVALSWRDGNEQLWHELAPAADWNRRTGPAWALLVDALADEVRAKAVHLAFQDRVVAILPHDRWTLTRTRVLAYVAELEHAAVQRATVQRARRGAYRR